MDSSNWLQGTIHEEGAAGIDSSSSPISEEILTCSRPLIVERRLRPPHDHSIKCPRCDSTHTKFCYYNNYSLSQPRYFCKTCRRYWTEGGTLRNIPVGGGCRINKKVSSKKSNIETANNNQNPTDIQLSFPDQMPPFSHHHFMSSNNFGHGNHQGNNFMLENHTPIDFMESKYEALVGTTTSRNQDFLGNGDIGMISTPTGFGHEINSHGNIIPPNFAFGMTTMDAENNFGTTVMDSSHHHQRLMLPNYENNQHEEQINVSVDVKPNPKILSLEWHDQVQGCSDAGKESFGYYSSVGGLGSWTGLINSYGSSATNPLV